MKTKSTVALVAGAILLIGATAGASVYVMENMNEDAARSEASSDPDSCSLMLQRVLQLIDVGMEDAIHEPNAGTLVGVLVG